MIYYLIKLVDLRPILFESINWFCPKRIYLSQLIDFIAIQKKRLEMGGKHNAFSVIQMITWASLFFWCVGGISSYFFAHIPIRMPPPFQIL